MPGISPLPFQLIAAGNAASGSQYSLEQNLGSLAQSFGIEPGDNLFGRLQERVGELLSAPHANLSLQPGHIESLSSFVSAAAIEEAPSLEEGLIGAFAVLHALHVASQSEDEPAARDRSRRHRRIPTPLLGLAAVSPENRVFAELGALRPAGSRPGAPSFMISASGVGGPPRGAGRSQEPRRVAASAAPSTPPAGERQVKMDAVAGWVRAKGGRPDLAIQRVLIVNNGMSATRLVKGIRSLSDRIAIQSGLNPAQHQLIDVVGMASRSDIESGANYLGEVDRRLVMVSVEKAGDLFLNYEQIFRVAAEEGVDTLVLGWGFVAEKADFVRMAVERGFNVVGPPHTAMTLLGGKISSKVLAEDAQVEVLPWTKGAIDTAFEAVRFARDHEFRVAIKADAGGGGKGIRLIDGVEDPQVNYSIWTDPIGIDAKTRTEQMGELVGKLPEIDPEIPNAQAFLALSEQDQAVWIQILRLANILRRRREWLSREQDGGIPEAVTLLDEARALIRGSDSSWIDAIARTYILENHIASSFQSAADEGRMSFKDPTVFCEVLAPKDAKHIEIQVDADLSAEARALLERDCSGQIRRQKMFEEGPAVFVSDDIRREMREAAVRVSKKAGYTNLGTCEFLYSPSQNKFWFMEMNTRLQVEHPVTELLLQRDLVELQLMRAMGIPVSATDRAEVEEIFDLGRHVVAARINARDPNNAFAASPGRITKLRLPEFPNVRAYFSLREGSEVSTSSDSQIGHVFAWGDTREQAITTLRRALEATVVEGEGIRTTIEFSIDALGDPVFQAGTNVTINWLDKIAESYADRALPVSGSVALNAAAIHSFEMWHAQNRAQFQIDLAGGRQINRDHLGNVRTFELPFEGEVYEMTVRRLSRDLYALTLDGVTTEVGVSRIGSDYVLNVGGQPHEVFVSGREELKVQVDGRTFAATMHDPTRIKAFTSGSAWRVLAKKGQKVKPGDPLIILESMKMEMPVEAEIAGTIKEIHVREGQAVNSGQLLVEIEPEGEGQAPARKKERIRLEADPHSLLYAPDRLRDHFDRYPMDNLHEILVRIMSGATYPSAAVAGEMRKGRGKEITLEAVILEGYRTEAERLQREIVADPENASAKAALDEMLRRLQELIDLYVRDERGFAATANERATYKAAGDRAFDLAVSHARLESKTRIVLGALEILRGLPYTPVLPSLRPMENFRADPYRPVRNLARDLIDYATPRGEKDPAETERRILEAARMTPFTPQRNRVTDELIAEPLISASTLLALVEHGNYEVRALAGYILLRRSYARHRVEDRSFVLTRVTDLRDEYSSWTYFDGTTGAQRLGIAMRVSPSHGTLVEVLERAGRNLATQRGHLSADRDGRNDTVEILVAPEGHGDYEDAEDLVRSAEETATRVMGENPPKRVTISVRHNDGRPSDYYTLRPNERGEFREDLRFRGLDPFRASLLEMGRLSGFGITKVPTDDHAMHLWTMKKTERNAEGKEEIDERLTVRTLVRTADIRTGPDGLTLPEFSESYEGALKLLRRQMDRYDARSRPPMNHLFFNILPVMNANMETARRVIEATVRTRLDERPVSPIVRIEVLAKVRDNGAGRRDYHDVLFLIDQTGTLAAVKSFVVVRQGRDSFLVPGDRFQQVGGVVSQLKDTDFKPMGVPYRRKLEIEKLRAVRQATGNVYVYDRPAVLGEELKKIWEAEGLTPPEEILTTTELVLQDGRLQETDRSPMQNDRSMVAWRVRASLPHEESPREFVMLSSDYTHKYGSVSPREGEFYDAVVDLAERVGLPFLQVLEGTGARIALDPTIAGVLQDDPATGTIYITEKDFHGKPDPKNLESGSSVEKIGDLVEGEWVELDLKEGEPPQRVFRVDTVIGGIDGLNTENLTQGSGRMAGRLERAYESIPTMTIISDTVVGILTYLARIGRRVIQVRTKPQLLTGYRTLNGMYKRGVFTSNRELGDGTVMLPNGVAQYGAENEPDSFGQFLRWLGYLPRRRGEESPVRPGVSVDDRDVGRILLGGEGQPGVILDASGKVQGYDPRRLIETLFDEQSFQEAAEEWGKVVVAGHARIGGVPVGVIAFDSRTQTLMIPPDPVDAEHRERRVQQGGSVWHPDAAYKTAQMLFDFEREGVGKVILANVKGFPGGSFDMGPGSITKFGAMIVEAMTRAGQGRRLTKATLVVVPPYGEVRGGAQVVIDSYLNRESIVYLMDEQGQMSVLPRDGMFEVPVVANYLRGERRYEARAARDFWGRVVDAHQTPQRALHVGSVQGLVSTGGLRTAIHEAIVAKQREVAEREATLAAQAQLRAIAIFAGISVTEAPDGSLIVGASDVFGDEGELKGRFDELLARANARRG